MFHSHLSHTVIHGSGDAGEVALQSEAKESVAGGVARKSTRMWAQQSGYEPEKIFNKVSCFNMFISIL